jgi:hypothetical protein
MHKAVEAMLMKDERRGLSLTEATKLGRELYKVNKAAVVGRYGRDDDYAATPEYEYRPVLATAITRLKALQCLAYQCSENGLDAGQKALLSAMERRAQELALKIVMDLPAYDAAPWGD